MLFWGDELEAFAVRAQSSEVSFEQFFSITVSLMFKVLLISVLRILSNLVTPRILLRQDISKVWSLFSSVFLRDHVSAP